MPTRASHSHVVWAQVRCVPLRRVLLRVSLRWVRSAMLHITLALQFLCELHQQLRGKLIQLVLVFFDVADNLVLARVSQVSRGEQALQLLSGFGSFIFVHISN